MERHTFLSKLLANAAALPLFKSLPLRGPKTFERQPVRRSTKKKVTTYRPTKKGYRPYHNSRPRPKPLTTHERLVNSLTNWQRNQWARDGYPKSRVAEFAALEKRAS